MEVRNLTVNFDVVEGSFRAVDDVSFDVFPRRTVGIVGESGCGKSVTAAAIMRIEDTRICRLAGSVRLFRDGRVIDLLTLKARGAPMRRIRGREIGLVFQDPMTSFSPVHTIGNQIIEAVRLHFRVSKARAYAISVEQLQSVGMPHPETIMSQYSWELSGGLRQRAMIAMALVCGPRLLIADEPTTSLDVTTQAQVLALLKRLQAERDMALVLITHDLGVVAEMADEVLIMYLGNVVEYGSVHSIFREPKHPYTQLLLDSLPNINRRRLGSLKTIQGTVPRISMRPTGCSFHTRCPYAMPGVCDVATPTKITISESHFVACHLHGGTGSR